MEHKNYTDKITIGCKDTVPFKEAIKTAIEVCRVFQCEVDFTYNKTTRTITEFTDAEKAVKNWLKN